MSKFYITQNDLFEFEPVLNDYLIEGQINFDNQIKQAEYRVLADMRNKDKELKKIFVPLVLNEVSQEDKLERIIWITRSEATGVVSLYGSNDNTTFDLLAEVELDNSQAREFIIEPKLFYKIETAIECESYLFEASYYHSVIYMALSLIYRGLVSSPDDRFSAKSDLYLIQYQNELDNIIITYDKNLDGNPETITTEVKLVR